MECSYPVTDLELCQTNTQYEDVGEVDHDVWRPLKLSGTCLTGIDIYCHSSTKRRAFADGCGRYGAGTAGHGVRRGCNREITTPLASSASRYLHRLTCLIYPFITCCSTERPYPTVTPFWSDEIRSNKQSSCLPFSIKQAGHSSVVPHALKTLRGRQLIVSQVGVAGTGSECLAGGAKVSNSLTTQYCTRKLGSYSTKEGLSDAQPASGISSGPSTHIASPAKNAEVQ
ncbi:hypothetical protein GE09DRAFT_420249 [Coniochaeta sp. 2T2.1]|nr:hypothetical protein GE09DRAFT_420249 [Coniochaeta sp. 2T2.1]